MKYAVNDKPGLGPMLLYGLQWWAVSLPCVVIMGVVVSRLHFDDISLQAFYLQKLFALTGVTAIIQILLGHRMPLVVGPATILLVGMTASIAQGMEAIYSAILVGGAVLALLAFSGVLARLRFFFTPRIVSVILVLIAFTLTPTILNLVLGGHEQPAFHLCFAVLLVLALIICNKILPGVLKSLTVIIGIGGGTLAYFAFQGFPAASSATTETVAAGFLISSFDFHAGTVLSFLFCFLALLINELGSVESLGHLLKLDDMPGRIKRGVGVVGLANVAAGGLGVIGSVDYSLSAGVIAGTGNASRFTLIPAGIGLILCAMSSDIVLLLSHIPGAVMGSLMLYLMAAQLSSGLTMLVAEKGVTNFESGITVGLSLMVGLMIAFTPGPAFKGLPDLLRPIVGNGFVMGTITVIMLEHVVFRARA
ncbi:xanthine permease [Deltaproteobacteria bacterium Smac51]|nr:xanthine permease [Deltaproteobacteria bacterium Smac51]